MNVLAMERELGRNASDEQINAYLAGNLCRCTDMKVICGPFIGGWSGR